MFFFLQFSFVAITKEFPLYSISYTFFFIYFLFPLTHKIAKLFLWNDGEKGRKLIFILLKILTEYSNAWAHTSSLLLVYTHFVHYLQSSLSSSCFWFCIWANCIHKRWSFAKHKQCFHVNKWKCRHCCCCCQEVLLFFGIVSMWKKLISMWFLCLLRLSRS